MAAGPADVEVPTSWPALARALIADGALGRAGAVAGDLELRDASSRNANAIASQRRGGAWFIKKEAEPGREAAVYRRLSAIPELAPYVPRQLVVDRRSGLLLLEVADGAKDLWEHHRDSHRFPPAIGHEVGRALGLLHRSTRLGRPRPAPDEAPAQLSRHRPRVDDLRTLSPAAVELVAAVQRDPALGARLDELQRGWTTTALMHGDVKWPNIITQPSAGRAPTIHLVDWEQTRDGDPVWDIGSALGDYVCFWLYSIRPTEPGDRLGRAARARFPIAEMRPAIRACWEAYLDAAGVEPDAVAQLRRRTAAFCAARLMRTAYEDADTEVTVTRRAALHLQVAANVLADPDAAADRLLGLGRANQPTR